MATATKTKPQTLTFAELMAMAGGALIECFQAVVVKAEETLIKSQKTEKDNRKVAVKVVAAMKRLYVKRLNASEIPSDTSETKFFKANGGEIPARLKQLGTLFNAFGLDGDKPLIPETAWDAASVSALETAAANIAFARKQDPENWKGNDDVLDTINALTTPGDAKEALLEIRKRQKGEGKTEKTDGENAVVVTPSLAAQYLCAAMKDAGSKSEEEQLKLVTLLDEICTAWAENSVPEATKAKLDTMLVEARALNVPPGLKVVREEAIAA